MVKRLLGVSLLVIVLMLLVGSVVHAQEAPLETNTPNAVFDVLITPEPAPVDVVVTPAPSTDAVGDVVSPSERTLYVLGFLVFMLYAAISKVLEQRSAKPLIEIARQALNNKQLQDEARERYVQSSLPVQDMVKFLEAGAKFVGAANLPVVDPLIDTAGDVLSGITSPQTTVTYNGVPLEASGNGIYTELKSFDPTPVG